MQCIGWHMRAARRLDRTAATAHSEGAAAVWALQASSVVDSLLAADVDGAYEHNYAFNMMSM